MVSNISFLGIASGLDTNAVIDALMEIQRRPIAAQEIRRDQTVAKRQALQQVGTTLSTLLGTLDPLRDVKTFNTQGTSVLASTDDANKLLATANGTAALGSFDVDIVQLATSTRVRSAGAIGQAIDSAVPLDEAGFLQPFAAGTFTINSTLFTIPAATGTTIESAAAVGTTVTPTAALDAAGLDLTPVDGSFEINGVPITYTAATDTLNTVISRINASAAGVTASFGVGTNLLTLTADDTGPTAITLADTGGGNFLEAMQLIDGGGATIGTETAGTNLISLDDVVQMINLAGAGVTASIENDAAGRPNLLRITDDPGDGAQAVLLGSGGDTSNFLDVAHLLESPGTTTRESVRGLGGASVTDNLQDARLATAPIATGTFEINGVQFDYDVAQDSLSDLITRINQSTAAVTASYDPFDDTFVLAADETGSTSIQLSDVSGDLLAQLGLLSATQQIGANAQYQVDGGPIRYSSSNVVTDAVNGVTLTFNDTTDASVTVEVFHDAATAISAAEKFVEEYNKAVTLIDQMTAFAEEGESGLLLGDGTLRRAKQALQSILTGTAYGVSGDLRTLSDVGISFGAVGSAVGTTNQLVLDQGKLQAAIDANPDAVAQLFTTFKAAAALEPGGTGSIASIAGTPTAASKAGTYSITSTVTGQLSVLFQPADGSAAISQTGSIAAGGTNTTLIPGVTLTAAGALVAGTDSITITATEVGLGRSLHSYVDQLTRSGGTFDVRDDEFEARVDLIDDQIERLERRADAREQQLQRQFAALEVTIARLQGQQEALAGMVAQLNANRPQNN
jgi:flagellar hook-associated protein 2